MPIQIVKRWGAALPFASVQPCHRSPLKVRKSMLKSTMVNCSCVHTAPFHGSRERLIQQFDKLQHTTKLISAIRSVTIGGPQDPTREGMNEEWNTGRRRCGQVHVGPSRNEQDGYRAV